MLNRRQFLATPAAALGQPSQPPNIVFILADDLGYGDLGCYGQDKIATPDIDRLAAEGTRFSQAYAGSTVCAPSRCSLMTGLHTGHGRIRGNGPDIPLRREDLIFPELLKRAGYRTGAFGKWALGGIGTTGYPTRRGFDEWFGHFNQTHAHAYYPDLLLDGDREVLLKGNFGMSKKKDYAPDLFAARAIQFVENSGTRSGTQPFFLYFATTIPHTNNEVGRETGNGQEVPEDAPYSSKPWPQVEKNFAAMVTRLDRQVGDLLAKLPDNTLVIFTSDNGPHREGGHVPEFFRSSGLLRGQKRDLYEGGIRVPFIARWKGRIPAGGLSDQIFAFWDMMPTLCEAAGIAAPAGIDGSSQLAGWLGQKTLIRRDPMYWEFHENGFSQAVRAGDWKLIRRASGEPELFNLREDPAEKNDLAGKEAPRVAQMTALMASLRKDSADFPIKPRR